MKSLTVFAQAVLEDFGNQCGVSTALDRRTIARRVEHEGEQFLTLTLPAYGKDFLASLEAGRIEPNLFQAFKHGKAGLPRFLGGFLALVFDECGTVLDEPSIDAIRAIHGFTAMFGKMKVLCSEDRIRRAMKSYVEVDREVGEVASSLDERQLNKLAVTFRRVFGRALQEVERSISRGEIIPKHGPGSVADGSTANAKYMACTWTKRLEFLFPAGEYLYPNWGWYHHLQEVNFLEPHDEPPVRVIAVPKTAATPRIIAIEPVHMQYVQQGILEALTSALRRIPAWDLMGNLDQEPNRLLARKASIDRSLATLDLSEASDRVSVRVVDTLLRHYPLLREAVMASRSQTADVLGHGVITLAKFASMGSALCFPIESMVFTAIVLQKVAGTPYLTDDMVKNLVGRVRVYGDDIIVPSTDVVDVIEHLEAFGLKVNVRKSFWKSNFRESCGMDAYAGVRVTPIRMRKPLPTTSSSATDIATAVAFRNELWSAGAFPKAVRLLDAHIRKALPNIRWVPPGFAGIGLWTFDDSLIVTRFDRRLHRPVIRAHKLKPILPRDDLGEHGALMKFFLKRGEMPRAEDHLQRYGRPQAVHIQSAWLGTQDGV